MKKFLLAVTVAVVAIGVAVPVALSANVHSNGVHSNGIAPLMHYGLNPAGYEVPVLSPGTPASGVVNVHYNNVKDRFMATLLVHGAMPKTTYVLDIRYWAFGPQSELGTLTTNSKGMGFAHFAVSDVAPTPNFYIDISVKNGGGGAGGYGDTFIAGPFTLG